MSLAESFLKDAYEKSVPLFTTIEITHHCNLRCRHCYNFDRTTQIKPPAPSAMMEREKGLEAIRQVAQAGGLFISLTGGEALTHPDVFDFIREIRQNNSVAKIKSNGLLLKKCAEELKQAGLNEVDISIYGAREETYQNFSGRAGLASAIEGIRACLVREIKVNFNIVLHSHNAGELHEMISLAESLGLRPTVSTEMTDRYDGTKTEELAVTNEQFQSLLAGPYGEVFTAAPPDEDSVQCPCARTNCGIALNGDVYPCIGAPIKAGNLQEEAFASIWQNSPVFHKIRGLKLKDFSACSACSVRKFCDRSSGGAYANTGNYTGPDPQACRLALIRHKEQRQ